MCGLLATFFIALHRYLPLSLFDDLIIYQLKLDVNNKFNLIFIFLSLCLLLFNIKFIIE